MKEKVGNTSYEIEKSMQIGHINYVIAINDKDKENPYFVGNGENMDMFVKWEDCCCGSDWLEAVEEWSKRISTAVQKLKNEQTELGIETVQLTLDDVETLKNGTNIIDKIIVIKPEILMREYRTSEHQLYVCKGGFGSEGNSRGRAVFCDAIYDGKHARFNREDILGVIYKDKLPKWSIKTIEKLQRENENIQTAPENSVFKSSKLR